MGHRSEDGMGGGLCVVKWASISGFMCRDSAGPVKIVSQSPFFSQPRRLPKPPKMRLSCAGNAY